MRIFHLLHSTFEWRIVKYNPLICRNFFIWGKPSSKSKTCAYTLREVSLTTNDIGSAMSKLLGILKNVIKRTSGEHLSGRIYQNSQRMSDSFSHITESSDFN